MLVSGGEGLLSVETWCDAVGAQDASTHQLSRLLRFVVVAVTTRCDLMRSLSNQGLLWWSVDDRST